MTTRKVDEMFAQLKGEGFYAEHWKRLDRSPIQVRQVTGEPPTYTLAQFEKRIGDDAFARMEASEASAALEFQLAFAEHELDKAEAAGAGETPAQMIDRKKLRELWVKIAATTDDAERGRLATEILEMQRTVKPNEVSAARAELNKFRRDNGLDDEPAGNSPLVKNAEKRRREFEASRR